MIRIPFGGLAMSRVALDVEVPYEVTARRPRSRDVNSFSLKAKATVSIDVVDADMAPVELSVAFEDGRVVDWRRYDGDLWRPILDAHARPVADVAAFVALMSGDERRAWVDYPFCMRTGPASGRGTRPFDLQDDPTRLPAPYTLVEDRSAEALMIAHGSAAREIKVIDGTLYRRSTPPVWTVGRGLLTHDPSAVRLKIPDYPEAVDWIVAFPIDQREEAEAFSAEMMRTVREWARTRPWVDPVPAAISGASVTGEVQYPPPEYARSQRRLLDLVLGEIRLAEVSKLPYRFLRGYGAVGEAVERLDDYETDGIVREELSAAIEVMIEGADPEWPSTWLAASSATDLAHAMRVRERIEAERERRLDLSSFAVR